MSVNLWPQWFPMEARHPYYYEASAMIIGLIDRTCWKRARPSAFLKSAGKLLISPRPPHASTEDGEKSVRWRPASGCCCGSLPGDRVADGEIARMQRASMKPCRPANPFRSKRRRRQRSCRHCRRRRQRPVPRQRGGQSYPRRHALSHGTPKQSSKPRNWANWPQNLRGIRSRRRIIALFSAAIWYSSTGAANCLYAGHRQYWISPALASIRPGDANVDYFGAGAALPNRRAGTRDADALQRASCRWIPSFLIKPTLTEGKPQVVAVVKP